MKGALWIIGICCFWLLPLQAAVEVGQYDDPRDLTLKIHDPFSQENADLMQPVVGKYDIKILPPSMSEESSKKFDCEGLFFKQVGKLIFIDIRKPPQQQKAGAYDLAVTLKIPGEPDSANRLRRHIIYTDAATDVLLVIDNSRSMVKNDPDGLRYEACENFVHLASLSRRIQRIGVIKFSGTAKIELPWSDPALAKNKNVSRLLANSKPGNFTNINEAFELSAKMFEDSTATEKVLVLLTDGKNEPDIYRDTHKLLREQGVRIFTVGLSNQSDATQLQTISQETGGEFFKAVDDARLLRIYNKIAQQLSDFKSIQEGEAKKELFFPITSSDDFVDINIYNFDKAQRVQIIDESGAEVPYTPIVGNDKDSTRLIRLAKPKPGRYRLRLGNGASSFAYDINTNSKLFMKLFPLEKKYLQGEVAHIAVSLAQRSEPMLAANIRAKIFTESKELVNEVALYDDGVHGDNHANDGVYCAVVPLDMPQGRYQVELRAEGATSGGESYVRHLQDYFYLLESSKAKKDYFLASILPLYLDLGSIEQRSVGKGSVRLSFEGRHAREVSFGAGDNIQLKNGSGVLPWSAIEFPEKKNLNPSQAEIFTLRLNVPRDQALGVYSGTVLVRLGDQELWLPLDIKVLESTLTREASVVAKVPSLTPRDLDEGQKSEPSALTAPKMLEHFNPSSNVLHSKLNMNMIEQHQINIPKESEKVVAVVPIKVPSPAILFDVSPMQLQPFIMEEGAFASVIFEIKNLSAWAGNVKVSLDGVGEMEKSLIQLEAGANVSWSWGWQGRELKNAPQQIKIVFSNASKSIERQLNWSLPQAKWPYFLLVTLVLLGIIAIVYGILYFRYGKPAHGFISSSSLFHMLLVLLACRLFWPPAIELSEPEMLKDLTFELLKEELVKPEELKVEMPAKEEQLKLRPVDKSESAQARELKISRTELNVEREVLKNTSTPIEASQIEIKTLKSSVPEVERKIAQASIAEEATATVISVNDRPMHRARLEKRSVVEVRDQNLKMKKSDDEIVRQRLSEQLTPSAIPQKVALQELESSPQKPKVKTERESIAISQPEFKKTETQLPMHETIKLLDLQKEQAQTLKAQTVNQPRESTLQAKKENLDLPTETPLAAGNVLLPKVDKMTSLSPMSGRPKIERPEEKMDIPRQEIAVKEQLAVLQTKKQEQAAVKGQNISMDYRQSELIKGKDVAIVEPDVSVRERKIETPRLRSEVAVPLMRAEAVTSVRPEPNLSKSTSPSMELPRETLSEITLQTLRTEKASTASPEREVKFERTSPLGSAPEKKMETVATPEVNPVDLERRELLGEQEHNVQISDKAQEKRVRSLPLHDFGLERSSPDMMTREKIKK